jgi:hypothetical protein
MEQHLYLVPSRLLEVAVQQMLAAAVAVQFLGQKTIGAMAMYLALALHKVTVAALVLQVVNVAAAAVAVAVELGVLALLAAVVAVQAAEVLQIALQAQAFLTQVVAPVAQLTLKRLHLEGQVAVVMPLQLTVKLDRQTQVVVAPVDIEALIYLVLQIPVTTAALAAPVS